MNRLPLIVANWKMNKTHKDAQKLILDLKNSIPANRLGSVVLALPYTSLPIAVETAADSLLEIAAQNVFKAGDGAYTGEVSTNMLVALGVKWVLVGHSERRTTFHETEEQINKKLKTILTSGLKPILCVGEDSMERDLGVTFKVLARQLGSALEGFSETELASLVLAYEPVWAIGTGVNATSEQAQEAHIFLRETVGELVGKEFAQSLDILYGGSVKPDNVAALLAQPDIDGALVGGASLESASFINVIKNGLASKY